MTDDSKQKRPDGQGEEDAYVLDDAGDSTIEEIEHEMELAAQQAAGAVDAPADAGDTTLRAENRDLKDRYMRTLADFENYRKRSDRDKSDFYKYAVAGLIKELLPVLDNFDRALDHAEEGDDFHKGVLLIYKQMLDVLQKHGIRLIDQSGVKFDPNIHEAVMSAEDPSVPSGTVVQILQKGYFLHDRLLRPALVKVAVGGPEQG